jgi:D-3-phosphoglycerate dehydrogenase / 2-oxoglutarate reductase
MHFIIIITIGYICTKYAVIIMMEKKITSYPKEKINILFLENISDAAVKFFNAAGYATVKKINGALSEEELIAAVKPK